MRELLLTSCVVFILISCNQQSTTKNNTSFKNLTATGDSLLLQKANSLTNELGLSSITNGVDSFELRIWYGWALTTPHSLIALKYQAFGWKLTKTDYWYHWKTKNGRLEYPVADSFYTRSLTLPANISAVVDSIYNSRLDTLPSQRNIPNFNATVVDGVFYTIETSSAHFYKLIDYGNPDRYNDWHNRKITDLLTVLSSIGVQ